MRIFLTGATGFIGSHIIPELIGAGHQVVGLTRSDAGATALRKAGAEVYRGTLDEPEGLTRGAAESDAVIHAAFDHDFSNFVANCGKDARVIAALGSGLKGSKRPLLITSGIGFGGGVPGAPATEDRFDTHHPNPRIASELAGMALAEAGVAVMVMRLPQVHDTRKQGLITPAIAIAREKGVSAYVGDGQIRWSAAAVGDVARLYRLAIEQGTAGERFHAVAESGVPTRAIAEVIGRGLGVPVRSLTTEEAAEHFGWMAGFASMDMPASSAWTQARLGWHPTGPRLIEDLERMDYAMEASSPPTT